MPRTFRTREEKKFLEIDTVRTRVEETVIEEPRPVETNYIERLSAMTEEFPGKTKDEILTRIGQRKTSRHTI